jgi:hypothetical protein
LIYGANLLANTFDMSLANECTKLIGLKSDGSSATSLFGIKVMEAPFSLGMGPVVWLYKHWKVAITSALMMPQHDL